MDTESCNEPISSNVMSELTGSSKLFGRTAAIITISVVLIWLHTPALHFHFWYDDFTHIFKADVSSWKNVISNFHWVQPGWGAGELLPFYRPLSHRTYFGVMRLVFGLDPLYYHISCRILFALISFNIYLVTTYLSRDRVAGFIGSILFATNTSHAISQMWVSVTPDLLVVFLLTTAFYIYLLSVRRARVIYRMLSTGIFVLALLAKEAAVILPGLIFLFEVLYARPSNMKEIKCLAKRLAPFAIVAMIYLLFRLILFELPDSGPYKVTIGLFALRNLGRYFLIAINDYLAGFLDVPNIDILHIAGDHMITNWYMAWLKFSLIAVAAICVMWWQKWDLRRDAAFAAGWFTFGMLPTLFLPNHFYLYYLLPSAPGLAFLVGKLSGVTTRTIYARSRPLAVILFVLVYAMILGRSTLVLRKEQNVLHTVSVKMQKVEDQLRQKVPYPPENSSFFFSGDYGGGWWRNLTAAIRVIYDNPNLYAADISEEENLEMAMKLPFPVYFVHVSGEEVQVSRRK